MHEVGIIHRIELTEVNRMLSPLTLDAELNERNPLGKVPALVLENGEAIFDSRVICEYLDTLHQGPAMFPSPGYERWRALTFQALADGILDAAVLTRYELKLRPEEYQWPDWAAAQKTKMFRSLDSLEDNMSQIEMRLDIGAIAVGCALAYLDFRYPEEKWRNGRPMLTRWYEEFASRKSMRETSPV